jgi:hypothetical protein
VRVWIKDQCLSFPRLPFSPRQVRCSSFARLSAGFDGSVVAPGKPTEAILSKRIPPDRLRMLSWLQLSGKTFGVFEDVCITLTLTIPNTVSNLHGTQDEPGRELARYHFQLIARIPRVAAAGFTVPWFIESPLIHCLAARLRPGIWLAIYGRFIGPGKVPI